MHYPDTYRVEFLRPLEEDPSVILTIGCYRSDREGHVILECLSPGDIQDLVYHRDLYSKGLVERRVVAMGRDSGYEEEQDSEEDSEPKQDNLPF